MEKPRYETIPDEGSEQGELRLVVEQMLLAGVRPLPRNYELFYEAFIQDHHGLRHALLDLDANPNQETLDELARSWLSPDGGRITDKQGQIRTKVDEILSLLASERASLEKYGSILGSTSERLLQGPAISPDLFAKVVSIVMTATDVTLRQNLANSSMISSKTNEIEAVRKELDRYKLLADTDALTGLPNRRAFETTMSAIYADKRRTLFAALALVDVDRFKAINDGHGHSAGDKVLQRLAKMMASLQGQTASVFRVGGEEFAIVTEGLTEAGNLAMAEEVRSKIDETPVDDLILHGHVTVSIGLCMASEARSGEDLYACADMALYASKMRGRNLVTMYPLPSKLPQRKDRLLYQEE